MIGILGFNDLHLMQFLYKYTNILDEKGIPYEVVYWNRSLKNDSYDFGGKAIPFDYATDTEKSFFDKIGGFVRYAHFMHRVIRNRNYDKLIVLTSQTAVPLSDLLLHRYAGKYIYDYRDITKELGSRLYRKLIRMLFHRAHCIMISSKGFLKALDIPKSNNVIMSYNTQKIQRESRYVFRKAEADKPIRITYWGKIRQVDYNMKVCDAFGNDSRFEVTYHGVGQFEALNTYCREKGYKNIHFTGYYTLADLDGFAVKTDILNCLYENDVIMKYALPVKMNDAINFRLPLLITKDSYLSEYVDNACGMYSLDINVGKKAADLVYEWYKQLDCNQAEDDYNHLQEKIYNDDVIFRETLLDFCQS